MLLFTWTGYVLVAAMLLLGIVLLAMGTPIDPPEFVLPGTEGLPRWSPGQAIDTGTYFAAAGAALGVLCEISFGVRNDKVGSGDS